MSRKPPQRILVVDDEPLVLHALQDSLQRRGYQVDTASTGQEALEHVHAVMPDLIILDLLLPGMDGFEVFQTLKRDAHTRHIPIILLTGVYDTEEQKEAGLQMGAAGYIIKERGRDFNAEKLAQTVEQVLEHMPAAAPAGASVVIIDDDRLNQAILQRALVEAGYHVRLASEGARGLEIVQEETPDLVLLDYRLPDADGLELLRKLRAAFPDMAIVFMTAYGSEEVAVEALRSGADDYLIKPFRPWHILTVVEEGLEKARQRRLTRILLEELRQSNLRLRAKQQELEAEHQALQEAYRQLEQFDQLKEEWLSMMVHDLKSPISILLSVVDLLGSDFEPQMDDEQRAVLEGARRASAQLLSLMSNLLDVQRMEMGKLALIRTPLDLNDLVRRAGMAVMPRAREQQVSLLFDLDKDLPPVPADEELVERVLANLLDNALKFTPAQGQITLFTRAGTSEVQAGVADTGAGIPAGERQRIFEKFTQLHRTIKGARGSGLGLTFCRLAVEAHGGRIWVEDNAPQGSRFIFTLPLRPSAQE
ncbi:MAG: response regulator [Anaerolineae bacterium]